MPEQALVIFVYLVMHERFLTCELAAYGTFETLHYLLQNRLVEDKTLAFHYAAYITTREQFATLQNYTIGTGIEHIHP